MELKELTSLEKFGKLLIRLHCPDFQKGAAASHLFTGLHMLQFGLQEIEP